MSTRPYATQGGLRIRQCYNRRLIEYRQRCRELVDRQRHPIGACSADWDAWVHWVRDWEAALLSNRDRLIEQAEQRAKEQRSERKRKSIAASRGRRTRLDADRADASPD